MGRAAAADDNDEDDDEDDEDDVEAEGREDVVDGANFLSANSLAALQLIGLRQEGAARAARAQQDPGTVPVVHPPAHRAAPGGRRQGCTCSTGSRYSTGSSPSSS